MFVSNFFADRLPAGAAVRHRGSRYEITDAVQSMAMTLRKSVGTRVSLEPAMEDAFFDAAEVVVENLRGATDRVIRNLDKLIAGLLEGFPEVPTSLEPLPFPVALVGEILTVWKVRVDIRKVANWATFAARYGSLLLLT